MYVKRVVCFLHRVPRKECGCSKIGDGCECTHCGHVTQGPAMLSDTPFIFCWNCVRTKKAFEPVAR